MSYLEAYQSSLSKQNDAADITNDHLENVGVENNGVLQVIMDCSRNTSAGTCNPIFHIILQAKYKFLQLKSSVAQGILTSLDTVHAIDLSHNVIDEFPHHLSPNLIALDVSYNLIERPLILTSEFNLMELNLSNNKIAE